MLSSTRLVPPSLLAVLSRPTLEPRLVARHQTRELSRKSHQRRTSGGDLSTSQWSQMYVYLHFIFVFTQLHAKKDQYTHGRPARGILRGAQTETSPRPRIQISSKRSECRSVFRLPTPLAAPHRATSDSILGLLLYQCHSST